MRALKISKFRDQCSHSGSRLHDSLKVAKNNNVEIQCGCVLLLIWKMMLLDFFGSKFCKKCEHSLACFQFFIWSTLYGHLWDQKKGSVLKRCPSFRESYKRRRAKQGPALAVQFMVQQDVRQGILYFKIQHESYSTPGLTTMLNFNIIIQMQKEVVLWMRGHICPQTKFQILSINIVSRFCISVFSPSLTVFVVTQSSVTVSIKARLLIRILPYQSLQKVGYFSITVKMLTCNEVLIPVGLIFSYSHIEYVVSRLRQHTEIFGIQ